MNRKDLLSRDYAELCNLLGIKQSIAKKMGYSCTDLIDLILTEIYEF